jgi:hypothetical protein
LKEWALFFSIGQNYFVLVGLLAFYGLWWLPHVWLCWLKKKKKKEKKIRKKIGIAGDP